MYLSQEQIQTIQSFFQDKPVKKVYVFGSYARGEADEQSDVDLLVDIDYEKNRGWQYFSWYGDLSNVLSKKVEVVSSKGLSEHIAPFIHKDKKLLYAR